MITKWALISTPKSCIYIVKIYRLNIWLILLIAFIPSHILNAKMIACNDSSFVFNVNISSYCFLFFMARVMTWFLLLRAMNSTGSVKWHIKVTPANQRPIFVWRHRQAERSAKVLSIIFFLFTGKEKLCSNNRSNRFPHHNKHLISLSHMYVYTSTKPGKHRPEI